MLSIFARRVESMREASGSYEKQLAAYRHWSIGRTSGWQAEPPQSCPIALLDACQGWSHPSVRRVSCLSRLNDPGALDSTPPLSSHNDSKTSAGRAR